jgi:hypothetical protein
MRDGRELRAQACSALVAPKLDLLVCMASVMCFFGDKVAMLGTDEHMTPVLRDFDRSVGSVTVTEKASEVGVKGDGVRCMEEFDDECVRSSSGVGGLDELLRTSDLEL